MTQIGADGLAFVDLRISAKSADKVPSLTALAKRRLLASCLAKNPQKTGFFALFNQALGSA